MREKWLVMGSVLLGYLIGCQTISPPPNQMRQPPVVKSVAFRGDEITRMISPTTFSRAYILTSIGYEPITINEAQFNGEVVARLATFDGKQYVPSSDNFPVTLSPEHSITLFESNPDVSDYSKDLRYILLQTSRGALRHNIGGSDEP